MTHSLNEPVLTVPMLTLRSLVSRIALGHYAQEIVFLWNTTTNE